MSKNFHLAPPSKTVDGLLAVPIDIESVNAVFTFDGATQTATADATINYTVGPTSGNPIFDLRQNIVEAWLDGVPFPTAKLAHHVFGVGTFTDLRVIEAVQATGSVHTLRVRYNLGMPNSQLGGSYLPGLEWLAGPKLRFVFGLSDLNKARYAEAWLPANLVFDQFSISLELQITGTMASHSVITNGTVANIGLNHWNIEFPDRFSALSPMLEVRSADALIQQSDTVVLPVSGKTVTIEAWKLTAGTANLTSEINNIKSLLTENENNYGAYCHANRFVAFFNGGSGMEYEGGTTTSSSALKHETFHSWFARGIKPAAQSDGWWDEGFTTFVDEGADDVIPFDYSDPPIVLCSRDPWQRNTPGNSYTAGSAFWKGIASIIGVGTLNAMMRDLYESNKGKPVSTQMIEEFLLCKTGNPEIVDAFHWGIYGLANPSPIPDLWLRDATLDPGEDHWGGTFWDSPDLWIRNSDDGGTVHQPPEYGQDNWFHARVRNKLSGGDARHFVVTFHSKGFVGTEFLYPMDFLPCISAKADFDLAAGDTRVLKAKWPRSLIPAEGTHTCLLASVLSKGDRPLEGRNVWEHNNLAQKNLVVVDLEPNTFFVLPVVLRNAGLGLEPLFDLEIWRPDAAVELQFSLIHKSKAFLKAARTSVRRFKPEIAGLDPRRKKRIRLECGSEIQMRNDEGKRLTSNHPEVLLRRFPDAYEAMLEDGNHSKLTVNIPAFMQNEVGLKIAANEKWDTTEPIKLHFVQRNVKTQQIVGGVAIQLEKS